jgi:acyl phosphate:glycerol-3-phosphate acyltransferase
MAECIIILQILILGYCLGSIPFGVVLAKLFKLPDPRYIGSGNIGATNMLRTGNKKVALLTLLLDAGKGALAVVLTRLLFGALLIRECHWDAGCVPEELVISPSYLALAILAAAVGHMYSPWLKFKGGKGVATLFGGALAFSWPVGMAGFLVWAMVMFVTRYVSLASITALAIAPLVAWLRVDGTSAFILAIACGIAIWKHRENIKRLRQGFEPKMGLGKGGK